MMSEAKNIRLLEINRINILNPRHRNKKLFTSITDNIMKVGLKRPIVVKKDSVVEGMDYDLICGQGRIEAFLLCGQTHIPAIVVNVSESDAFIMSLIENLARRNYKSTDIMRGIKILQEHGYDARTIAEKIGLSLEHTSSMLFLLDKGEERLLAAVENGTLPVTVAVHIASAPDNEQKALQEAYESGLLRGKRFIAAKKILSKRRQSGKFLKNSYNRYIPSEKDTSVSAQDVLKVYRQELERKVLLIRNAEKVGREMQFIVTALRQLLHEELFTTILKAEYLVSIPKQLALLLEQKNA